MSQRDLLSELCGPRDRLWPADLWPLLRIDGALESGVVFGHGPIRYRLLEYVPGRRITFALIAPYRGITAGFNGIHEFTVVPLGNNSVVLRHEIRAQLTGIALLVWPLAIRPVHNALIEDGFEKAQAVLAGGLRPKPRWSLWVRTLRLVLLRLWPEK